MGTEQTPTLGLPDSELARLRFERIGRSLVRRFGTRAEIREMNKRIYARHFGPHDSTPEERKLARAMWEAGHKNREIARRLGRSKGTIWHWSQRWKRPEQGPSIRPVGNGPLAVWAPEAA